MQSNMVEPKMTQDIDSNNTNNASNTNSTTNTTVKFQSDSAPRMSITRPESHQPLSLIQQQQQQQFTQQFSEPPPMRASPLSSQTLPGQLTTNITNISSSSTASDKTSMPTAVSITESRASPSSAARLNPIEPPVSLIGPSNSTRVFDFPSTSGSLAGEVSQQHLLSGAGRPISLTPPPSFTTSSAASVQPTHRASSASPTLPSAQPTTEKRTSKFPLPPFAVGQPAKQQQSLLDTGGPIPPLPSSLSNIRASPTAPSTTSASSSHLLPSPGRLLNQYSPTQPAGISKQNRLAMGQSEMSISPVPYDEDEEMRELHLKRKHYMQQKEEEYASSSGRRDGDGDEMMGEVRRSPALHRPQYLSGSKLPSLQSQFAPEFAGGSQQQQQQQPQALYSQQAAARRGFGQPHAYPYYGTRGPSSSSEDMEIQNYSDDESISSSASASGVGYEEDVEQQQQQPPPHHMPLHYGHPYHQDYRDTVSTGRGTSSSSRHLPLKLQQKSTKPSSLSPPYSKRSRSPSSTSSYSSDEENAPTIHASSSSSLSPSAARSDQTSKQSKFNQGAWTTHEHEQFLQGLQACGHQWKKIAVQFVQTRSRRQVASHAQKYLEREKRRSAMSKKDSRSTNRPTLII